MSAREELYNIGVDDMPVTGPEVDKAIAAFRAEVLLEAISLVRIWESVAALVGSKERAQAFETIAVRLQERIKEAP